MLLLTQKYLAHNFKVQRKINYGYLHKCRKMKFQLKWKTFKIFRKMFGKISNPKSQEFPWLISESRDRFLKLKVQKSVSVWIKILKYFNSHIVHVVLLITLPRNSRVLIRSLTWLATLIHHKVTWELTILSMAINEMAEGFRFEICSSLLINSKIIMLSGFPIS